MGTEEWESRLGLARRQTRDTWTSRMAVLWRGFMMVVDPLVGAASAWSSGSEGSRSVVA